MILPINENRLLTFFKESVFINSPSKSEHALAKKLIELFSTFPVQITENASIDKTKPNLLIRLPSKNWDTADSLLLSTHMDTIESTENIHWILEENIIKTDGSTILGADDKSGIAIILEIMYQLDERDLPHPEIEILFSTEEEIHLLGIKDFDEKMLKSKKGIVLDSDGDAGLITHIAPSHFFFTATIQGVAAHAGMEPENGKSAILFASQVISSIPFGRIDSETTSNIGVIQGGSATNIVAENCFVNGEVRSLSRNKLDAISQSIQQSFLKGNEAGYKVIFKGNIIYNTYSLNTKSSFLENLSTAGTEVGLQIKFISSGGGSDANVLNDRIKGMECVVLSCGMMKAHTHNEYIDIQNMFKTARWLLHFITKK